MILQKFPIILIKRAKSHGTKIYTPKPSAQKQMINRNTIHHQILLLLTRLKKRNKTTALHSHDELLKT
jgi:hypothetical protein